MQSDTISEKITAVEDQLTSIQPRLKYCQRAVARIPAQPGFDSAI
jgi:hypothetical protein